MGAESTNVQKFIQINPFMSCVPFYGLGDNTYDRFRSSRL